MENYSAVSYCWGSQEQPREISLGGASFMVTRNLFEILLQLRASSQGDQILWIDALCINQLDVDERNSQVRHMHIVYEYASVTLICSGPASDAGAHMMRFLDGCPTDGDSVAQRLDSLDQRNDEFVLAFYQGLAELYLCEYWTRVWVVQEIYHSRYHETEVLWGGQSIDYVYLERIREANSWIRNEQNDVFGWSTSLAEHALRRVLFTTGTMETYSQLDFMFGYTGPALTISSEDQSTYWEFEMYRNKKCSDARDYVYGYYHLLPDGAQALTKIDYRASLSAIFLDATLAYIQATKRYDILIWPKAATRSACMDDCPSWARDWSQTTTGLGAAHYASRLSKREATDPCMEAGNRVRALSTQGIKLGTVIVVCTMVPPREAVDPDHSSRDLGILHENMLAAYRTLQALPQYEGATSTIVEGLIRAGMTRAMCLGQKMPGTRLEDIMTLFTTAQGDVLDINSLRWLEFAVEYSTGREFVAISTCHASTPYATHDVDFGMINPHARIGDSIFVLDGCRAPVVLRKADTGSGYTLVGDAYITSLNVLSTGNVKKTVEEHYFGSDGGLASHMEDITII